MRTGHTDCMLLVGQSSILGATLCEDDLTGSGVGRTPKGVRSQATNDSTASECGSLIATYTTFSDGNNLIACDRSTDGGASWTFQGTAPIWPSASSDLDDLYVLQLPSGRLPVAFRDTTRNPRRMRIHASASPYITPAITDQVGISVGTCFGSCGAKR